MHSVVVVVAVVQQQSVKRGERTQLERGGSLLLLVFQLCVRSACWQRHNSATKKKRKCKYHNTAVERHYYSSLRTALDETSKNVDQVLWP